MAQDRNRTSGNSRTREVLWPTFDVSNGPHGSLGHARAGQPILPGRNRDTVSTEPTGPTLSEGRIVTDQGILEDGWLSVRDGKIAEIGTGPPPAAEPLRLAGRWVLPGFVDMHCHGGGGGSFGSRAPEQIRTAAATHRAHGTTTMLASLVTDRMDRLCAQIEALRQPVADGVVNGIHLEGPFLAAARCGAHDTAQLRDPDRQSVKRLLAAGGEAIRMVTVAPELDGAVEAIRTLTAESVVAAIGHTDAVADQVLPAVEAGATVATHLFNGMRPLHHREPGPVGVLLDDERVTVELICDLVHLHPIVAGLAARHAGPGRTVAVTDAISATEAGDGTYELGGLPVTVSAGEPRLSDGSLAGSTLTMDAALRNLVNACGLSMVDAVRTCSTTPAELLGLDQRLGAIRGGLAADLVVMDDGLVPTRVMHNGEWIGPEE